MFMVHSRDFFCNIFAADHHLFCEFIFYKAFVMFFQLTIFIYFLLKITI